MGGGSRSGNGAMSGGYRIRLERGAAFSPAPLRSHVLLRKTAVFRDVVNVNVRTAHHRNESLLAPGQSSTYGFSPSRLQKPSTCCQSPKKLNIHDDHKGPQTHGPDGPGPNRPV